MDSFAGRSTPFVYAALVLSFLTLMYSPAFAASKVQTKRVFVPEETEKSAEKSGVDDLKPSFDIPSEALPNIEPQSNQDDEDDVKMGPHIPSSGDDVISPPPPVMRDLSKLPEPVRRTRDLILKAAKQGNIEELRTLLGTGATATSLSIGGLDGDPIAFLKEESGDEEGFEILAILIEVLESGYVHLDAGKKEELYVWPYFFAWPFEKMTPVMNVELYSVLTAGDVEDSKDAGRYIFYRVGIKPDGQWSFFVSGD